MLLPIDLLPAKLILRLASPYIAGRNVDEALALAEKLYSKDRFTGTLDVLGELAKSEEECRDYVETYFRVIDLICQKPLATADRRRRLNISFKPSMFCVSSGNGSLPSKESLKSGYQRMEQVVQYAFENEVNMTLEAEESTWTEYHLNSYFSLLEAGFTNLGTVLQTRLYRTASDIERFDQRARVRLVIGIYEESSTIAYKEKQQMKKLLIDYSRVLFNKGAYVELATHDHFYIDRFFNELVRPLGISADRYELQFLLGVPRYDLQKELTQSGNLVRLYLPFGSDQSAGPYCKRRLQHNPSLLVYGLKNLIGIQ